MIESVEPVTQPIRIRRNKDGIWNILTFIVLLSTLCVALAFLVIFINPQVPFNPFPPPVLAKVLESVSTPTLTPTQDVFPATWTPEPPPAENADPAAAVEATEMPVAATLVPTEPPSAPENTGDLDFAFTLHGTPAAVSSTLIKADVGCSWMGVAGQALDTHGSPIVGLLIKLTGVLGGNPVDLIALTGTQTLYGEGGFELKLADQPLDSVGEIKIQLLDNSGLPISEVHPIDTYADCKKNLILINFRQVKIN